MLALSHADVDKTNKSYYGESNLHFISTDASFEGSVPLSKWIFRNSNILRNFNVVFPQVRRAQFMMFSGPHQGRNLWLFMDVR